jgi:hypothetical protein
MIWSISEDTNSANGVRIESEQSANRERKGCVYPASPPMFRVKLPALVLMWLARDQDCIDRSGAGCHVDR